MHNIVITGVSTGIGEFVARKFMSEGHRVFGSVRKALDGARLRKEFPDLFTALIFDVTDELAIKRAAQLVGQTVGTQGIQLLINNAGIAVSGATILMEIDEYRHQFEVNFFGVIAVTKAFLPLLGTSKSHSSKPGKIFNISSVSGQISYPFLGPYCSSKFALEGFSHALRRELLIYGIDVVIIGPGSIKTPIWDKAQELTERELQSDYANIMDGFRNTMLKEAAESMPVEKFANMLYKIYRKRKGRARYAIVDKKFIKWTIPRYFLGPRQLDRFFKKMYDKIA